jgi:ATP/maltotriose-dependent transcriptional regulator MalT
MTASATQPKARPQRRIIERPRLIKLLDDSTARTILLIAPAGYGKTTLARQWAKTLNGAIWVTLTPAHRDVALIAESMAAALGRSGSDPDAAAEIQEHVRARVNPQRAATDVARAVALMCDRARTQWIVLDDYHEITASFEAEEFFRVLETETSARLLIVSRVRPQWVSGRRVVYGDALEVDRAALAMTDDESQQLVGRGTKTAALRSQAKGWPAVLALAASAGAPAVPAQEIPEALHRYLAEELFNRVPAEIQEQLLVLALTGQQPPTHTESDVAREIFGIAYESGFSSSESTFDLHPLLRDFLLAKLKEREGSDEQARAAAEADILNGDWDHALEIVTRFDLLDLVDPALRAAYKPLVRAGRLATLAAYAEAIPADYPSPPDTTELVAAELALADGNLDLAHDLAVRAVQALPIDHALAARASSIVAQIAFFAADFVTAEAAYERARRAAQDEQDEMEAVYGLAMARVFGEHPAAAEAVAAMRHRRDRSPVDYLRAETMRLAFDRLGGQPQAGGNGLEAVRRMLPRAQDPRARTSLTYTAASHLAFQAEYDDAQIWLKLFFDDAQRFGLEFALPFGNWTDGQIALGQRRYAAAERAVQAIEDSATRSKDHRHLLNAKLLRARLSLQTGDAPAAVAALRDEPDLQLVPSWRGEYLATKALALACAEEAQGALDAADGADAATLAADVRLLAQAARAITDPTNVGHRHVLSEQAQRFNVWDPIVCAARASPALATELASDPKTRDVVEALYARTRDNVLARRAGFRTRVRGTPDDVLSPRELEVLELISRGLKNKEISRALYIADSTTKVHVRHILEKLGVRTRAQAVARYQLMSAG